MEIDLLICCTVTADIQFPATANIICDKVGAKNAWGFDLNAACSGFLYGLTTGSQFIETGKTRRWWSLAATRCPASSTTPTAPPASSSVMAPVPCWNPTPRAYGIIDSILRSDGSGCQYPHQKAGGSNRPATARTVEPKQHYVYQEGKAVFKFAVTNMADVSAEIMENGLKKEDVGGLVPHQANKRIIDATAHRMGT